MTLRSPHTAPIVVVYSASGGVGTTTVAAALAMVTQVGHPGGHTVLVDVDGRAFDVLGRPPYSELSGPDAIHHRGVQPGIDVVCWPQQSRSWSGVGFDALTLAGVVAVDPEPGDVNAVVVDAATPTAAAMASLARESPAVRTVLVTSNAYPALAAARDHVTASGALPDEIVVVEDPARVFGVAHFATWWPAGTQLRPLRHDPALAEVVDAGMFGLTHRSGEGIFPLSLAGLQGSAVIPASVDRRRLWAALHASRPDSAEAARQMSDWAIQIAGDRFSATGGAGCESVCVLCSGPGGSHHAGCPATTAAPALRCSRDAPSGLSIL